MTTARGTAIGAAILKGLDAIAEVNPNVAPVGDAPEGTPAPTQPGDFVPDIVVVLTDGANTRGIDPVDAAQYAAERHVRVYTIGFGTTQPAQGVCTRAQLGGDANFGGGGGGRGGAGGGFGGGGGNFLMADEPSLRAVAAATGGTYYKAEDAAQLSEVFADLPKDVDSQKEKREITMAFTAFGALLAAAAVVASIKWSPYP